MNETRPVGRAQVNVNEIVTTRDDFDENLVAVLVGWLQKGLSIIPECGQIAVRVIQGIGYCVIDGNHKVKALRQNGNGEVEVDVYQ